MTMTWGEFKAAVDKEATDDMPIDYIDITMPDVSHESTRPEICAKDGLSRGLAVIN